MYWNKIMKTDYSIKGHHLTDLADSLLLGVDGIDSLRIEDADAEDCL